MQELAFKCELIARPMEILGQHRNLTDGISELKIDVGPGYRVYCTQRGEEFIILLVGGNKSSQHRDISTAQELARNLQE